jgi:hypothetical protein
MRDLDIKILSEEFGQYDIYLRRECGHIRKCFPKTLASIAGWDAKLDDVVKRLRCSKCHQKKCIARTVAMTTPHRYGSH